MGNSTSGIHGSYVIARARKPADTSVSGSSQDGVHLVYAAPSPPRDCHARKDALEKIDGALDSVLPDVFARRKEPPTAEREDSVCTVGALVDIGLSKRLKALRILQGCCNFMTQIPAQICFLKNLRSLALSNNQIHSLPDDIGECFRLKEINLSNNRLVSLPASFSKLSRLGALNIAANRFSNIPMCIASLKSLRYLNVERNYIKAVPIEVLRLKRLVKLRFHGNPLVFAENIDAAMSVVSLMEICARKVFCTGWPLSCAETLTSFVKTAKTCSFCAGPYYERVYEYTDVQTTIFGTLPVHYRLCSRHFDTKKDKIEKTLGSKHTL
ncbi:UNVERIFIED_CONTAM: hypothetical protein PYX00_011859 [Menopon gallinae]|uniref:Leucine-rich repeat-containing protein 58 n=1 Tax=Menopon gallinae TaxID=328185 RepID=A0AAW2H8Z3_9NEOP